MIDRLPKEIIYYSLIPVIVIVLINLFLLLFMRKKNDNSMRFSMLIKLSLILAIAIVLPLIAGYTVWVIEKFINKGILLDNILYVLLIIFLSISLFVLIIWVFRRTLKYIDELHENRLEKK